METYTFDSLQEYLAGENIALERGGPGKVCKSGYITWRHGFWTRWDSLKAINEAIEQGDYRMQWYPKDE